VCIIHIDAADNGVADAMVGKRHLLAYATLSDATSPAVKPLPT
jgi:hypothetical protein